MAVSLTCCTAGPRGLRSLLTGGKVQELLLEERLRFHDAAEGKSGVPAQTGEQGSFREVDAAGQGKRGGGEGGQPHPRARNSGVSRVVEAKKPAKPCT